MFLSAVTCPVKNSDCLQKYFRASSQQALSNRGELIKIVLGDKSDVSDGQAFLFRGRNERSVRRPAPLRMIVFWSYPRHEIFTAAYKIA